MSIYKDAFRRAAATFIAGATAAPITSALMNISFFKAAAIAGFIAVWNWAGRAAQTWINERKYDY